MIHVRGVAVSYRTRQVLQNVSFSVARGEIVVILGRNGAGKTTLLKALVGLVRPDRGQILIDGKDIAPLDTATICRRVGYVPQDPNALLFADTVLDELRTTLRNHGMTETPFIHELIARLQLSTKGEDYPRDLSVGERQRVALGAILVTQPTVLLLDEPTRGLDYAAKHALCSLLQQYRADGTAIVIVTHDVEFAAELADRVVVLGRGEVIAQGSFAAIAATSPLFAPQTARLFPHTGWMTPTDALRGLGNSEL